MKILFLTKFSEVENYLLRIAQTLSERVETKIDLLHVVNSYPQVPLKGDGTIIDQCFDYDLTDLYKNRDEETSLAEKHQKEYSFIRKVEVEIGNLERIVNYKLSHETYDMILMGSHATNLILDLTHESTVERILNITDIPVFTVKSVELIPHAFNNIGVFDEFKEGNSQKLDVLNNLSKTSEHSIIHLYKIVSQPLSEDERQQSIQIMEEFASINEFKNFQTHIIETNNLDDEALIQERIQSEKLDLVSVNELQRHTFSWLLTKNLKQTLADHLLAPLLIYSKN